MVEDDDTITGVLERHLTKWGYLVQGVRDFSNVLEQFLAFKPHLTLLDISLPFYSGYHWCEEIRKASKSPILFLSSAGDDMNQVMALSLGADGFVVKPFLWRLSLLRFRPFYAGLTPLAAMRIF